MQMALIIVTGYVLASSRPVALAIARLARVPRSARGATAMVALFSMLTAWLNWGFSLIFAAMLARETARHRPAADYRALAASSFLGLGSIWAQGLSGSAALQMATPGALPPKIRDIVAAGGVVPGGRHPAASNHLPLAEPRQRRRSRCCSSRSSCGLHAAGGARAHRGAARRPARTHRSGGRPRPGAPRGPRAGRAARARARAQRRGLRAGRRLPRDLLRARERPPVGHQRQHHQPRVPDARRPAARDAGAADARGARGDAGDLGRDPAVPFLRGDRRDDRVHAAQRAHRAPLRGGVLTARPSRRSSPRTRPCSASSCRRADRSG